METILVTGGAGFIGGSFVRQWLAEESDAIVNLDKLSYASSLESLGNLDDARHHFVRGDIADADLVAKLLNHFRPRAVVNLAAETHVDRSIDGPALFVDSNVVGTFRLLETVCTYWQKLSGSARLAFRFLHVSTDEVYGTLNGTTYFREDSPYAPNSPYAASKAAADHFVRAYHRTYGLPTLVTHCSNNYGPYQFPEKLVPLMILNAMEGRPLPVYGDGQQVRDWIFVDDHCRALRTVLAGAAPGSVYMIGSGAPLANLELVEQICILVDALRPDPMRGTCKSLIRFVEDRPGHDRRYAVDAERIRRDLGWRPKIDLQSGLSATVQWYLENRAWVDGIARRGFRRQRLGLLPAS